MSPNPILPVTILIVDDDASSRRLLEVILTQQEYEVVQARDGAEGLRLAAMWLPNLILLDVNMPGMSGYEVSQALGKNPDTAEIPIIFISAMAQTANRIAGLSAGGVDYISKPFAPDEVLARIQVHLQLRQLQLELTYKVADLEQSKAELDAFAHTVAHDLKNPLTALLVNAVLVRHHTADMPKVNTQIQRVIDAGRKIEEIIEGLLLLAGVRKQAVPLEPLDMGSLVASALQTLEPLREDIGAEVTLPEHWPVVRGYAPWVEMMWTNYISNALKYGARPCQITLRAEKIAGNLVRFCVANNGSLIPQEEIPSLFTEFAQLSHLHNENRGNGLGLSIVKRIAERLGGEAGYHVHAGQACFFFTLPGVTTA